MHVFGELIGRLTAPGALSGNLTSAKGIKGNLTIPSAVGVQIYDGEYEFTPTEETQTVSIANKLAVQDITINPIPSNYGRITWNGSVLTVS